MKHFILSVPPGPDGIIKLSDEDYHYLFRVRRLKTGMCFNAVLPGGKETLVSILSTAHNTLTGKCAAAEAAGEAPHKQAPAFARALPPIALFQSLPKGNKMDLIVRQAAEGAISLIVPFQSEHSIARPEKAKVKRWERIVKEARQQSGSSVETKILPPCDFSGLIELWASKKKEYSRPLGILLHEEALENGSFHDYLDSCPDFVVLAVGPEGGFSPREISTFITAGFRPLLLGNTVLRTETAALYGTAAVRIILLENKTWTRGLSGSYSSKSPSI